MGVVIVTYNSAGDILGCLNSLAAANTPLTVVVVDNASRDDTCAQVRCWDTPLRLDLTLMKQRQNRGFAAGVNAGLELLLKKPDLDRFWILNPDCISAPDAPQHLASYPMPFSLLGCRITYADPADKIQIDAGTVNRWTGATGNMNLGQPVATPPPDIAKADFVSGASMVASRDFITQAGLMPEDYFLYYEEVDWAARRGALPLAFCPAAQVAHSAGASIGSPTLARGPSPVSTYFKHRARMRFVARHNPAALPFAYLFGVAKTAQNLCRGEGLAARSALRALHGLPPNPAVKHAIGGTAQDIAKALTA